MISRSGSQPNASTFKSAASLCKCLQVGREYAAAQAATASTGSLTGSDGIAVGSADLNSSFRVFVPIDAVTGNDPPVKVDQEADDAEGH